MRDHLVGSAVLFIGLVNAVPSAAAINPVAAVRDYIEDDLSGSGREASESEVRSPQRRQTLRLRLLPEADRAALLRAIDGIPAFIAERVPGCAEDVVKTALTFQLLRAIYEERAVTVAQIADKAALPPALIRGKLRELEASGLVRLEGNARRRGDYAVVPTPALRACGDEVIDRLYYGFLAALNGR